MIFYTIWYHKTLSIYTILYSKGLYMQKHSPFHIGSIGLAIFCMLFGAGNLMYPLAVGMTSGAYNSIGMIGFLITAVCLPMTGLIAMILFEGNYRAFFHRIGTIPGEILIGASMIIIGPLIAIPRIVTLSHTMIAPFLPCNFFNTITPCSSLVFALLFLAITFLGSYKENKIVSLLGNIVSPILIACLLLIIIKGIFSAQRVVTTDLTALDAFKINFIRGYETLDLLGTIFFSSLVIHILRSIYIDDKEYNAYSLAVIGLQAGSIGMGLLAAMYIGMSLLGVYHGHGLASVNVGQLFSALSFKILGQQGSALISCSVLVACISTAIALAGVIGEYIQVTISQRRLSYVSSLAIGIFACVPLSSGLINSIISYMYNAPITKDALDYVLVITGGPILYIGYPVIIALTFCNIAYKMWGFKPVKLPVALTCIAAAISYYMI